MKTISQHKALTNANLKAQLDKAIQRAIAGESRLVPACTVDMIEYAAPQLTDAGLTVQVTAWGIRVSR